MAEFSMLWTTGTSGDGTSTYTQTQTTDAFRDLFVSDNFASQGVLLGNGGELLVTGTSSPVTVASGAAVVYGFLYRNTAAVTFAIATPVVGTTAHRIVLRADYSARTVRLAKLSASDGVNTPPALTQVANTTWEISLATLSITTGGVITVTPNTSRFAHFATAIATENIDDSAVTTAKINDSAVTTAKINDAAVTAAKLASAVAGDGLAGGAGTALSVNVDSTTIEIVSDILRLAASAAGNGLSGGGGSALAVNTDNSTIEISADTLQVKDSGISTAKLAADSVDDTKAGNRIAQFYRRQGGDANNMSTGGTTTYTPGAIRVQWGVVSLGNISAGAGGTGSVTFPTAFSQVPFVFTVGMQYGCQFQQTRASSGSLGPSTTGFDYEYSNNVGGALNPMRGLWIAIGTE